MHSYCPRFSHHLLHQQQKWAATVIVANIAVRDAKVHALGVVLVDVRDPAKVVAKELAEAHVARVVHQGARKVVIKDYYLMA